jgi:hemoglobin/transferrin/lactoferrin receptor protein
VVGSPLESLSLSANLSRGFRAPHMTDLGTLGLTGSGFEVAAPDVAGLGATVGDSAAGSAVSTGQSVTQVKPETSFTYEFGARYRHHIVESWFSFFVNDIEDNIAKQALILPLGAVGLTLGGQPITAQNPNGTVFVAASTNPVLVRVNFDNVRLWGIEHRARAKFGARWSAQTIFTYVHARDQRTDLPPNIEGGTPAPDGYLSIRYSEPRGNWWLEPYAHLAARQDRLSSLDLEDRRTGATRTRSSIQNFFRNGATVRGFVGAGSDGTFGNADDLLLQTGETLLQVQDRVLGPGVNSAPLFTGVAGYVTVNLRGGLRIAERHRVIADFENIGDRNYRGISWGMDAPGRSISMQYSLSF